MGVPLPPSPVPFTKKDFSGRPGSQRISSSVRRCVTGQARRLGPPRPWKSGSSPPPVVPHPLFAAHPQGKASGKGQSFPWGKLTRSA